MELQDVNCRVQLLLFTCGTDLVLCKYTAITPLVQQLSKKGRSSIIHSSSASAYIVHDHDATPGCQVPRVAAVFHRCRVETRGEDGQRAGGQAERNGTGRKAI